MAVQVWLPGFMTGGDADLKTVQTWIAGWLCGLAATGQVNVTADLLSVPRVTAGPEGTLDIIFDARPGSRRWKDWMVLLTPELRLSLRASRLNASSTSSPERRTQPGCGTAD
jgi:hypothetical protein